MLAGFSSPRLKISTIRDGRVFQRDSLSRTSLLARLVGRFVLRCVGRPLICALQESSPTRGLRI
jgi:hypothetical protein